MNRTTSALTQPPILKVHLMTYWCINLLLHCTKHFLSQFLSHMLDRFPPCLRAPAVVGGAYLAPVLSTPMLRRGLTVRLPFTSRTHKLVLWNNLNYTSWFCILKKIRNVQWKGWNSHFLWVRHLAKEPELLLNLPRLLRFYYSLSPCLQRVQ